MTDIVGKLWGFRHTLRHDGIDYGDYAELLEIFQWKSPQEVEACKSDPEERREVKEELGDILIYALNMCHAFGFDPSEAILEKLKLNEQKYPVEKAKGSARKYTET